MRRTYKIIGALLLFLATAFFVLVLMVKNEPPPLITANFTELDKIEKISKYRSCAGHTTVPQDGREMMRSMKHYFSVKPEYQGSDKVKIYSPFDGYVANIREDRNDGLEGEIWIVPKDIFFLLPPIGRWSFSIQHINITEGLKRGSEVVAGEVIGYAAVGSNNRNTFDVVYAKGGLFPKRIDNWMGPFTDLDSVFNHISDEVWAEYLEKGIPSKETLIIGKDERDKHPCVYKDDGPYFVGQDSSENWVVI